MTLQEAKDQVAKIHCYDRWEVIDWRSMDEINERTEPPFMEEKLLEEAAELYARSKSEKLENALREIRGHTYARDTSDAVLHMIEKTLTENGFSWEPED